MHTQEVGHWQLPAVSSNYPTVQYTPWCTKGSPVAQWAWLSWLAVRASCASKLAWLAVPWCERSLMAPTVRAVWWWSVQVAHNAHHQHHQGGQAQYGRVVGRGVCDAEKQ